jgi:fibronectin-binding autotransporter adhesin
MKPKAALRHLLPALGASILAISSASAQTTLTWDANADSANQTDGAAAWLGTNQWWDGITNADWTSYVAPDAIFGNGTAGGAVTLASPTTVGSITFNRFGSGSTYTIGTASQSLTINSGITINHNNLTSATAVTNNSVSIISNVILGGAQTWKNNAYNPLPKTDSSSLSVQGGINLNGYALTIDGIGTTNLGQVTGSIITGSGGIIKNGTGTLNLGGIGGSPVNTYTGGTTINGGIVRFNATDTPGTSGSFGAGGITINNGIIEGYFSGGITTRSLGSAANQIQVLGGTSGFSGQGGTASVFTIGTSGSALQFGSTHFFPTGGVFVLQSDRVNTAGKLTLNNGIDLNGANREITSLGGDTTGGATVTGAIVNSAGGNFGFTKSGAGNLILTNSGNNYTGVTNINAGWWFNNSNVNVYTGWITLSGSGTLNSTNALNLNGGTLRLVNTAQVNRFTDGSAIAVAGGGGISYENTVGANTYTETVGALTMNSGTTAITLLGDFAAAAGSQKLTLGNLTQNGNSTVFLSAGNAATTAPSATKNMIQVTGKSGLGAGQGTAATIIGPWATTGGSATLQTDYAVYDASGFIVPAAISSSTSGSWADSTKAYSLNTGSVETLAADASAQALQFYGAASELALGGFKLQTYGLLTSGANAKTISGGTLTTPTGGGNLYITTGRTVVDTTLTTAVIADNSGAVTLVKSGAGRLYLNGVNTYTGDTVINGGNLTIGGSANGTAYTAALGSLSGGTYTYAGGIQLHGGSTLQFRSSVNQTLSGDITGDGNLFIQGQGLKILSGDNTYTGTTTIGPQGASVGGMILSVSSLNSVFTDVGLGTVRSASSSLGAPTTMETGRITIGAGIAAGATLRYTGSGEITDRMINFAFNSASVYTVENTGGSSSLLKFVSTPMSNATITGSILLGGSGDGEFTGGLPFNFTNLTKNDNGTWTLGGAVATGNGTSGAGVVTVNAGTLALQKKVSIMGGDMAKWTNAKINVKSGATLALNVDSADANGISSASLDTLLTNISVASSAVAGLQSGARIGIDTSTATGGTFTQGNAIADSTGGSGGAIGLTKLGTGTLVLDKDNSYTGTTTVSAGSLIITGSTSSTSLVTVASGATLGGDGTVGGNTTLNGILSPGMSPGTLTFTGDLAVNAGSTYRFEGGDLTAVGGTLALNDNWTLALGTGLQDGGSVTIFTYNTLALSPDLVPAFDLANLGFTPTDTLSLTDTGSSIVLNGVSVIPEPRAALLGGLGLLMLLRRRR